MALALSPRQPARSGLESIGQRPSAHSTAGIRLSVECRTRRNRDAQVRYQAIERARRRSVFIRRRIVAGALLLTFAAAACLGVRAMASRGDGSASLPTVTPTRSAVLFTALAPGDQGLLGDGVLAHSGDMYVVQPGDTLWSIASSLTTGSIRSFVDDLIELNGSASVQVGQRLVLPED